MFAILPLLLDVLCIVHVARTGRDRVWVYIILGIPVLGAAVYVVCEMLPEFLGSYRGQQLKSQAMGKVVPERALRRSAERLEIADTVQNRMRLAEENMRLGRYEDAAALYRSALEGVYAEDTALLMGLARASAALNLPAETLDALNRLRNAHPEFQSNEAHMIYARSLEGLGRTDEALDEYAVLVDHAPGEEARCRYAMLLQRTGHEQEATVLFDEVLKRAKRAQRQYLRTEREWIDIARRNGTAA